MTLPKLPHTKNADMSMKSMERKIVKAVYKITQPERGGDWLAERAAEAAHYASCIEGGMVGIIRDGMDCDCSAYHREAILPAQPYRAWLRSEGRHHSWLDGPERTYVVRPSEITPYSDHSRDLAMEAFEDGRAHSIHWGGVAA